MSFSAWRCRNRGEYAVEYSPLGYDDSDEVAKPPGVILRRFLGLASTLSFSLGIIIGTGIFLTPAGVLQGTSGSIGAALVVWVLGGFIQASGALSKTELALYYKQSGGSFVYLNDVYGPAIAFVNTFLIAFIEGPCASAIQSIVIVKFLLTPFVGECDAVSEDGIRAGAIAVFMFFVFINSISASLTARTQVLLTFIKVGALLLVIVMGVAMVILHGAGNLAEPFQMAGEFEWSKLPSAFYMAYFAYSGWGSVTNVTEEVSHPEKTIVRGMYISFTCATILYVLANLAYFAVLSPEEMMASDAVAALFAVRVVGRWWSFIIWMCVVLSAAGNINGGTYTRSRLYFVAARAKKFPLILSTIHINRRTPLASILSTLPPTVIAIWAGDIWSIIRFNAVINLAIDILITLIVPYLRWKLPHRELPYKAPLWSCFLYVVFNLSLVLVTSITTPLYVGTGGGLFILGLLMYYLYEWTNRSPGAAAVTKSINTFLQKILLSVGQEAETY